MCVTVVSNIISTVNVNNSFDQCSLLLSYSDEAPIMTHASNRRQFIKRSLAASSALGIAPLFYQPVKGQGSANDRLTVGSIGTSIYVNRYTGAGEHAGRGAEVGHQAGRLGNMVAVADVNLRNARFFAKEYNDKPLVGITMYGLASVVSLSRYSGRRHFLSDVLM